MAALSSSQCSGSSAGASAAGCDCQPYSSNDFESFDSESEISSSREVGALAPGLLVVGGELWRSATLEWQPMPTTADHRGHIPEYCNIQVYFSRPLRLLGNLMLMQ